MNSLSTRVLVLLFLISSSAATAQSTGGQFSITRHTIDNGGGQSAGGVFSLQGIIGQPDAAPSSTGGAFQLRGGFLINRISTPRPELIFVDGFEQPLPINLQAKR